jgi:hypothetical protein
MFLRPILHLLLRFRDESTPVDVYFVKDGPKRAESVPKRFLGFLLPFYHVGSRRHSSFEMRLLTFKHPLR